MRVVLVCSSGGHLIQLHQLKPWWEKHERTWVTFDLPDWRRPSVFVRESDDRWRTESGMEQGEALRLERDGAGRVVRMVWAGYPVTREPAPMA